MGIVAVEYRDGGQIVRKHTASRAGSADVRNPTDQADAEQLAVLVAHALGLRAPAVVRSGEHEIEMEHIDGVVGNEHDPEVYGPTPEQMRSLDGQLMGILDQIINNMDRNSGNYLLAGDRIVPIDHSLAFWPGNAAMPQFSARNLDLTRRDMERMRARLVDLVPDFERLGRRDWFDEMLGRLDSINFA